MEKGIYVESDCIETGSSCSIKGKVIVLKASALGDEGQSQLCYCVGGDGAEADAVNQSVFAVDLYQGEYARWKRLDVMGVLKPELLSEHERLQLSQIRPEGALSLEEHEPRYSGYSFLPDGRYTSGVWLCSEKEIQDYVEMQLPYQHRIMICDRNDFCVLEIQEGNVLFPTEEDIKVIKERQEAAPGNMDMT
ncbi:hypothetical protein [Hungatella effluvii]|uniref:hypothetical protein n=1 Tax=Hungatella effluvii TaxID=1096246 RepID=UPI0022E81A16|nr:hypothetical protein [Hungatella effluvii]